MTRSNKQLSRGLGVWGAIGISIALMAPSMAVNINPQGPAGIVGRATPLAFAVATVGVLFIAFVFVKLSSRFEHAGSVYGYVGATLGPRSGAVSGWAMTGAYLGFAVQTSLAGSIFTTDLLCHATGRDLPEWTPFAVAAPGLAIVLVVALYPAKRASHILLAVEIATIGLILVVALVVAARLTGGQGPAGQSWSTKVFSLPSGTNIGDLFKASVFGFLSFAGFEAAATLSEETRDARRNIPRAILGTAIFGGIVYISLTTIQMLGFGVAPEGIEGFVGSSSLFGDLATGYVGEWLGLVITAGAAVGGFGCALACVLAASRLIYAGARDAAPQSRLARLSANHVPATAIAAILVGVMTVIYGCLAFVSNKPLDAFLVGGVVGTLLLLVAYLLATLGASRLLFTSAVNGRWWQMAVLVGTGALIVATIYYNVFPYPADGPGHWYPIVAGIWLLVGVLAVSLAPGMTRAIGLHLTTEADTHNNDTVAELQRD